MDVASHTETILRRGVRRALGLLCAVLVAASVVMWGRSVLWVDAVEYVSGKLGPDAGAPSGAPPWWSMQMRTWQVSTHRGSVSFALLSYESLSPDKEQLRAQWEPSMGFVTKSFRLIDASDVGKYDVLQPWEQASVLGWNVVHSQKQGLEARAFTVPFWFFILVGCAGLLWPRLSRGKRRARLGLCVKCGYDLRATAVGAACPECGAGRSGSGPAEPSERPECRGP